MIPQISPLGSPLSPPLAAGHLHEIHADADGWAAALGFVLAAVTGAPQTSASPIVLVRSAKQKARQGLQPCGAGWAQLGLDPRRLVVVEAPDSLALLRAGLDAARCPGLAAVVLETWGPLPDYDLTASRRLVLAAERSGALVIVLRGDAQPRASAAQTRWQIAPAPSIALAGQAPGHAALTATLQRQRGGASGLSWLLHRDGWQGGFHDPASTTDLQSAPLSGAVVPFPALRKDETHRAA